MNKTTFDIQNKGFFRKVMELKFLYSSFSKICQTEKYSDLIAVNRESINYYLSKKPKGRALAIVVGGACEILDAHPRHYTLCLAKRKGFIRAAIQNG